MSAVDVGGLGRRARVTSLSVALRGRLAPITARIGALALAVFLRPLLALVLLALVVAVPSFLVTDIVLKDTDTRLDNARLEEQSRAAQTAARIVRDRVGGLLPNTSYYWRVQAANSYSTSAWSVVRPARSPAKTPPARSFRSASAWLMVSRTRSSDNGFSRKS